MSKTFFVAFILLLTHKIHAQTAPKAAEMVLDNEIFTTVEKPPEFPGGIKKMDEFIKSTFRYPDRAYKSKVEGKVFLKFVVEKDGTISTINILQDMGFGCNEEAIRIIRQMPKWQAGLQNGKPVRVYFTMPITFSLKRKTTEEPTDRKMTEPNWYLPAYRKH